jgi:threonine/homoserine/homoserine lactone efflux protein
MTLPAWWIFVCATFMVSAIPGPNMLHIMTRGMRHGILRATFAMAGCMSALML